VLFFFIVPIPAQSSPRTNPLQAIARHVFSTNLTDLEDIFSPWLYGTLCVLVVIKTLELGSHTDS